MDFFWVLIRVDQQKKTFSDQNKARKIKSVWIRAAVDRQQRLKSKNLN